MPLSDWIWAFAVRCTASIPVGEPSWMAVAGRERADG